MIMNNENEIMNNVNKKIIIMWIMNNEKWIIMWNE